MWTLEPDLIARSVPRYTSYPTAAAFADGVDGGAQKAALEALTPATPLSLYLHIPYCDRICWYCGCNTSTSGRDGRVVRYAEALAAEIALVGGMARGQVHSIHFGGGSPNALPPADFAALMQALRQSFAVAGDAEIAVELDPRTLSDAFIAALAAAGVQRVSLGVQTFAAHVQKAINRIQPYEMVADRVAALRAAGIGAINIDLMYGLPGQFLRDIEDSIAQAMTLAPARIAMFGYAHLPRQIARQRAIDERRLPDACARFAQSAHAHRQIVASGYQAIGFDHFARPEDKLAVAARAGKLRRNFQGFTDDPAEVLIGLGASAISQFPALMVQNEKASGRYALRVQAGQLAGTRGVVCTAEDRLRQRIIERLLCDGVVDVAALAGAANAARLMAEAMPILLDLSGRDIVRVDGAVVRLLPSGLPYARLAAQAFDAYHQPQTARFSKAV